MKDHLTTLALALGALTLFYLFVVGPSQPRVEPTRPVSTETGPNGYYALAQWLAGAGIDAIALRERYSSLDELAGASNDDLMITTMPHVYMVRPSELDDLRSWVMRGNTLVVMAALTDTPEWSMGEGYDRDLIEHLKSMTDLSFQLANAPEDAGAEEGAAQIDESGATGRSVQREVGDEMTQLLQSQRRELTPNGSHPLLEGVQSVQALSEFPGSDWRAAASESSLVLELARNPQTDEPVLWLARMGAGRVIVSGYGSPFTNKLIGERSNARLLANIVTQARGAGGQVIIDDAHQGAASFYDAAAFYADARLHASLWWLLGLWLAFVLGGQRLRVTFHPWQPVDVTEFLRASGGFIANVVKPAACGERLFAHFFNTIRRRLGLPENGAPLWDWLGDHAAVATRDVETLQQLHRKVVQGAKVDLQRLHNLLVQVQRSLQ